jgi:hypothetical protein
MILREQMVRREEGLSMIEIMVATVFLFFALSVLLAVVAAASKAALASRMHSRAIYIANQKMEYLRSLDFDDVGYLNPQETSEPAGVLPRSEVVTMSGTTLTVTYIIYWVDDPKDGTGINDEASDPSRRGKDYKHVEIVVSWSIPTPNSYRVATNIAGRESLGVPPIASFTSDTLPDNSVVSGVVSIGVKGEKEASGTAADISGLALDIGGGIIYQSWAVSPPQSEAVEYYTWDTDTSLTPDGTYEIRAIARDARGLDDYVSRYWVVNNYAPTQTPVIQGVTPGVNSVNISFTTIMDGRDYVSTYVFGVTETMGANPGDYFTTTVTVTSPETGSGAGTVSGLSPWTTYKFVVSGYSYGDYSPWSDYVTTTTLIYLYETGENRRGNKYEITLAWSPPGDPTSVSVDYYKIYKDGGFLAQVSGSVNTYTDTDVPRNSTHTYQVFAYDSLGNLLNYSPEISVKADGVIP